ncbi:hypothetical protein MASSI9I_50509 [Massilia sp. 9I]|nr:hypothetical protein MASSI9I_50509 [Massilia sp. 9I]
MDPGLRRDDGFKATGTNNASYLTI